MMEMISRFIVWTSNNRYGKPEKHIYGIYNDIGDIPEMCNTSEVLPDGTLCDGESFKDDMRCTHITIDKETKVLYFVRIQEPITIRTTTISLAVFEDKTEATDYATNYVTEEHNRNNECDACPECIDNFIKSLEDDGSSNIACTDYESMSVSLWSVSVV